MAENSTWCPDHPGVQRDVAWWSHGPSNRTCNGRTAAVSGARLLQQLYGFHYIICYYIIFPS